MAKSEDVSDHSNKLGLKNKRKRPVMFNPTKFSKKDNYWLAKLGDKRSKFLRKLVSAMKRFNEETLSLPFDLPIISAEILHRRGEVSWFHNNIDSGKILLRLKGLDEEGIGMHLTERAKVLQWILWVPLIGDVNTSRQAPDRVWRESTYSSPSDFLLSYIDESKADILEELVADRWDSGMMLGGANKVRELIHKHFSKDKEKLKTIVQEWVRFLKWHQEFDWDEISEYLLFGSSIKLDVFWKNQDYCIPESFTSTNLWSPEKPNIAHNIREALAEVPGFEDLKQTLEEEASMVHEVEVPTDSVSTNKVMSEARPQVQCSYTNFKTAARRSMDMFTPPQNTGFRPDLPYNGANRRAFESHFMKRALWKNSPMGPGPTRRKRRCSILSRDTKTKRAKLPKQPKKPIVAKRPGTVKKRKRRKSGLQFLKLNRRN